ncbi:Tripartite tricarboxylate transporter TctA family protein [Kiritimatiella glycovorans]|uniref:Tripartite tricarboxylate transporter TctA family protein n=2 Tax=Kiritimatiella glycovorans TaxID=1307763 RepID=A0A0G3EHL3_9BACT|nr:Tripartite tricarboxylate transporter TctA family protein [Kiritimatiella glycovorans]
MMEIMTGSLDLMLVPAVWICLLAGVVSGMLVGAVPGLSATMGVALLVPFTFELDIMPAIALLVGIYCGAIYGGTVPAILFRTPGTPASAATLMDGYPMMQRGEAGRALALSAWSALIGGVIGTLLLIFLTPQISRFALSFGPAEFFALAVLGLSLITALSGESLLKGAIATLAGLLCATVGMDPVSGYPRFLFGSVSLMEGMPFIPVLIGLFAIAEVFSPDRGAPQLPAGKKMKLFELPHGRDMKRCGWMNLKASLIGTFTGSTPGAGADIAAFLCYSAANQQSKPDDRYGDGEPKGIAAAESGKTAATSGAMIPLLSLGIPGDSVTAVLIGAFILHGIQPGPLLFQDHGPLAYSILAIMLFAHLAVFVTALSTARLVMGALKIDRRFLNAGILLLSLMGAYALRANPVDCWVALGFGVLGVGMRKTGFPAAPFLLALILGGMAETNLRRALVLGEGSYAFFGGRPIALTLLLLAAFFVALTLWKRRKAA